MQCVVQQHTSVCNICMRVCVCVCVCVYARACAKSLQLYLTLCHPLDSITGPKGPTGVKRRNLRHSYVSKTSSPITWLSVSWELDTQFSERAWQGCACMLSHFSRVQLFATLWTVACQAPLSMGFSWQEYWNDKNTVPSSRGSSQPRDQTQVSSQEQWSGLPLPSPSDT